MKIIDWMALGAREQLDLLQRPAQAQSADRTRAVAQIIEDVRRDGDAALRDLTLRLDGCDLVDARVSGSDFDAAQERIDTSLKQAIGEARNRIEAFHRAAAPTTVRVETAPGVVCERMLRPIRRVGLYVPAGSAPLPSTALMLGVPAQLAGCPEIVLCTPPRADGSADPAVLYAARLCGIEQVFRIGGAQAIAAMAMGTQSVPRCDKLFGPGNSWVTEAKQQVSARPGGAAIDMPAGPSEVLVIADGQADPRFVAADLLSQAEHGPDSQVLLVTVSERLARDVIGALEEQLATLPRADTARRALASSRVIRVDSLAQAAQVSNAYAPEHLILQVAAPRTLLESIESAGSIFLGSWSPESVGDYCSGTNHVLPTYGHARAWSGVSVASFLKQITVQELTADGLRGIGECAVTLAEAEGLEAHARAVRIRLSAQEAAS